MFDTMAGNRRFNGVRHGHKPSISAFSSQFLPLLASVKAPRGEGRRQHSPRFNRFRKPGKLAFLTPYIRRWSHFEIYTYYYFRKVEQKSLHGMKTSIQVKICFLLQLQDFFSSSLLPPPSPSSPPPPLYSIYRYTPQHRIFAGIPKSKKKRIQET